ncbi:MAG: oxidoreductase [Candidatus Omnitrophota bacterium]|nr:MAG: oxidoreductase [Candidatus Omnitrophota bacterium]
MDSRIGHAAYEPAIYSIHSISDLTPHEKLFRIEIPDAVDFRHEPGQFVQLSVWGWGEAPISISNSPTRKGYLEFAIRHAGSLTGALHQMRPGSKIGLRGPFGNGFDVNRLRSQNLLLIAGGCGLAPLRSLIQYCEDCRDEFMDIRILYGAKTPHDLLYKSDLAAWMESETFDCRIIVDFVAPNHGYSGKIGLLPELIPPLEVEAENTTAVLVGPPMMYPFVVEALRKKGLDDERIMVSLERHMKCGIGKCGHCAIDHFSCCIDGPVFLLRDLQGTEWAG